MIPIVPANPEGIRRAAEQILQGGVIAYPTETVYGLGADPFNKDALDRLFSIKGRAREKALILLIRGLEDLHALTNEVPPDAHRLIAAFWPGPLTLIFKARPDLPPRLLGGGDTVGLRCSPAPIVRDLLIHLKGPITSTSANRSGSPPAGSAPDAVDQLGSGLDLVLDGGQTGSAKPSTVVDVSGDNVAILREGQITATRIKQVLEEPSS